MRAVVAAAVVAWAAPARAADRLELDVRLDVPRRALSGGARIELENASPAPLARAVFWLFPNRFSSRAAALDDVTFHWVYPRRFDPGFMEIASVEANGRKASFRLLDHPKAGRGTVLEIDLPEPIPAGGRGSVDVTWHVALPERYGEFGCTGGGCTLLGGFYPMPAARDGRGGWDLDAPPAAAETAGALVVSGGGDVVVAGVPAQGPVARLEAPAASFLPLVVAPRLYPAERVVEGVTLRYFARDPPPPADDAARQIIAYTLEDRAQLVLDAAAGVVELMSDVRAPLPPGTELVIVAVPLRTELAVAVPGMVVVSDKLLEIYPARRFRKFHERELVRALLLSWLARARDLTTAEAAAAYLTDLYTIRSYRKEEFVQKVLAPVSFVPAVDNMLYAPQIAFAGAYFGYVADVDKFRDDPRRFMNDRPHGSVYYEKLRDILPPAQLATAMRATVVDGAAVQAAAELAAGRTLGWFFRQWGGKYPAVDYRLGPQRVRHLGRTRWSHEITVERVWPAGATGPIEPVEVEVYDGAGNQHALRWDGTGPGLLSFESRSPALQSVEIDPKGRLVEQRSDGAPDDAKLDDRSPPNLTFLYNGFGGVLNVSDASFGLLLDFLVKRVHDVRHSVRLQLFSGQAITVGSSAAYTYHWGRAITPLKLTDAFSLSLAVSRLDAGFALAPSAGTRFSAGMGIGYDDRQYIWDPKHLWAFGVGTRATVTRFDSVPAGQADLLTTVSLSGSATRMFSPADGHTIVLNLEGAAVTGDIVTRSQLILAGGDGGLRGYGPSELFTRADILAHVEWRGEISHALDWNFGHMFMMRGISAALFLDAGAVSSCDSASDLFAGDNLLASAGFGIRFFYDDFGVQPGMTALDFAVPLVLRPRSCLGHQSIDLSGGRPPVMVYLTFLPPF